MTTNPSTPEAAEAATDAAASDPAATNPGADPASDAAATETRGRFHQLSTIVFAAGEPGETHRIAEILSKEKVGGILLLVATVAALVAANSPLRAGYEALRQLKAGFVIGDWGLQLTLSHWAADGLLAVFFFLVGLELKHELVAGQLRKPARALIPIGAAIGGVIVPTLIYFAIVSPSGENIQGWAIPAGTDIAFAVTILALVGRKLPLALRTFLLTLAVVDDLIAITIIAVFYSEAIKFGLLAAALVPLAIYAFIAYRGQSLLRVHPGAAWLLLLPLGFITWVLIYKSGIHATIAGVLLGFAVPVRGDEGEHGLAHLFEQRFRPLSAGVCVPVFAFLSAGVSVAEIQSSSVPILSPVFIGIACGLVLGKTIGVFAGTWLITRIRGFSLDPAVRWLDIVGIAVLAGIGFTVSLLITELSFAATPDVELVAKAGVLTGSTVAAISGFLILKWSVNRPGRGDAIGHEAAGH